jgi:hypothetical protein
MNSHAGTSAKASPAVAKSIVSSPAMVILPVIDDVIVRSPTRSGDASHTPSLDILIIPMEVEGVEYGTKSVDVHRSSVRDAGSMGIRSAHGGCGSHGGRPPQSKKAKNIYKPSSAWEHFTRDETSSQDETITHCNYCWTGYKCHPKINGTFSMLYHVNVCKKYKIHGCVCQEAGPGRHCSAFFC